MHEYDLNGSWYLQHSVAKGRLHHMCHKATMLLDSLTLQSWRRWCSFPLYVVVYSTVEPFNSM